MARAFGSGARNGAICCIRARFRVGIGADETGDGARMTVWGRASRTPFTGDAGQEAVKNGELNIGWMGMDARLGEYWRAGFATSAGRDRCRLRARGWERNGASSHDPDRDVSVAAVLSRRQDGGLGADRVWPGRDTDLARQRARLRDGRGVLVGGLGGRAPVAGMVGRTRCGVARRRRDGTSGDS